MTRTLHLTLHARWFDAIARGQKCNEYRDRTPFWQTRLEGRTYDQVQFRNGYSPTAPTMRVQCLGITTGPDDDGKPAYIVLLGQILELRNLPQRLAEMGLKPGRSDA